MRTPLFLAAALAGMLLPSTADAHELGGTWVSQPRALVTIVVGPDGGRVQGPTWEHRFKSTATILDFEIEPERRFVLRRSGDTWAGLYYHPRIRPGTHRREVHKMTFACRSGGCAD